ncbi:hypothetical protein ABW20_dc0101416 [Dactylellina cionopaga]|nr:hypothetical protein ABW20_dc0101416 [Dactylellina cionopaga]
MKLLQLNPEREILLEYVKDDEFKYLRALAAFYIRIAWPAAEVYKTLEPLMSDYRKLRLRTQAGFRLTFVDEFIDDLLTKERVCDIALPRIPTRAQLEDLDELDAREPLVSDVESDEEEERGEGEAMED